MILYRILINISRNFVFERKRKKLSGKKFLYGTKFISNVFFCYNIVNIKAKIISLSEIISKRKQF